MHINNLKKYYFINEFDTKSLDKLTTTTSIIYRNYNSKHNLETIIKLKKYCKKAGFKFFLSNNIKLALALKLDGAYIPSFNKNFNHLNYGYDKNFKVIGSAHNLKEIRIKELQKVEAIFISSLFKRNKNYLGIYKFKK